MPSVYSRKENKSLYTSPLYTSFEMCFNSNSGNLFRKRLTTIEIFNKPSVEFTGQRANLRFFKNAGIANMVVLFLLPLTARRIISASTPKINDFFR